MIVRTMGPAGRGVIIHMDEAAKDRVVAEGRFGVVEERHIESRREPGR
jgi:hypothetical protein